MTEKIPEKYPYKLSRAEAQLLANFARTKKKMVLPQGWITFYRLTPAEISKRHTVLSVDEIIQEARLVPVI